MTLASIHHHFLPLPLTTPTRSSPSHHSNRISLRATSSNPNDSSIFLPHLLHHHHQQLQQSEPDADDDSDPILRFFRTRSSSSDPDPPIESKLSLQRNRRTSWRLSPTIPSQLHPLDPVPPAETPSGGQSSPTASPADDGLNTTVALEVMQIATELPDNMTIGEALEGFLRGKKLTQWDCLEVLQLMDKQGMVGCALHFFEWMRMQVPSPVSGKACSVVFGMLGRAGMGKDISILFRNLPLNEKEQLRDVRLYNSAISGLMTCGCYEDAWDLYKAMEADNIHPDHVTCSIMITVMRRSGRSAKEAWEFFERMNGEGVEWGLEVAGALIKSFCDEGLLREALIIQAEMDKRGISSNAIVYNTLMDAHRNSNHIEECEGLLAEMRSKGIKPTTATYNILMDAYSRRMQPEVVNQLLVEMQDVGLHPDSTSYTCLISAYGRQKMCDIAADAFLKMRKAGIEPNLYSYTALIHAYSVSGWHEKAYISFENMLREGIKPSIETYTALLDAFRRAGDTEMLMKIWKTMIAEKIEGTRVTFNILLDGFAKQGRYVEARDVISEFGKIGFAPTVMTYNMLVNAFGRGGQTSRLPQLLKEMAALNLQPDSVTYSTMIYAFVRVRDFRRAFYYHKVMVKSGQVPDKRSYEKLRGILDMKAATKNRKDRKAILGIVNSRMGSVRPKIKRTKDEFWKYRSRRRRPAVAVAGMMD